MNYRKIFVTPEFAIEALSRNFKGNRRLRETVVNEYAEDMKNGNWNSDSPDPIIITKDGTLINGQHRLSAVALCGKDIEMYVIDDADQSLYEYLDNGLKRTATDYISTQNASLTTALLKRIICTVDGDAKILSAINGFKHVANTRTSPTRKEIINAAQKYQLGDICRTAYAMRGSLVKKGPLTSMAYFLWLCKWLGIDDKLDDFTTDFTSPTPVSETVQRLRNVIMKEFVTRSRMDQQDMFGMLFYVYLAYRSGKTLKSIGSYRTVFETANKMINEKRGEQNG